MEEIYGWKASGPCPFCGSRECWTDGKYKELSPNSDHVQFKWACRDCGKEWTATRNLTFTKKLNGKTPRHRKATDLSYLEWELGRPKH